MFAGDHSASARRLARIKEDTGQRITVVIPTLNEAPTIGSICRVISRQLMRSCQLVDELIVLDGGSTDETAREALAAGAHVVGVAEALPDLAVLPGKGESLWRSLALIDSGLVVWLDGDIRNFGPRFVTDLVAPLLIQPEIDFVKGFYRRPFCLNDTVLPHEGGRVTELLARPLLAAWFPELSGFRQPLAGEYAGRTAVLRSVPFLSGYGVEVGLLIDLAATIGLERMCQADLGVRVHRNRRLLELGPMAHEITAAVLRRAAAYGRLESRADLPWALPAPEYSGSGGERAAMDLVLAAHVARPKAMGELSAVR